jgi:hypothetical protein
MPPAFNASSPRFEARQERRVETRREQRAQPRIEAPQRPQPRIEAPQRAQPRIEARQERAPQPRMENRGANGGNGWREHAGRGKDRG